MNGGKIVVGVSGGVDSSVTALLLRDAGADVIGVFMQNWADDDSGDCRAEDDRRDAVAVCGKLGLPIRFRDFSREYWDGVFQHFLSEYAVGRTPNPDVLCNREIKFKHFLDAAHELGAGSIATGHYARVDCVDGRYRLLRAKDRSKDQSYFLHQLGQRQLAATRFPLGELYKDEVRKIATEHGLATAEKKDSTGICFIGERDFREFLSRYLPAKTGEIRAPDGDRIGEHPGVFYFTLGQREGLNIGGVRGRPQAPWFVVGKDIERNILYVDQGHDSSWLQSTTLRSEPAHWIAGQPHAKRFTCTAQTRYRQPEEACEVEVQDDGCLQVAFSRPQRAVTPGQSLVLYDGDVCLGGAIILSTDAPLAGQANARNNAA
ncbi:tRNA 2-thiouridine(34) synthase MnmA [Thermomonas sp. HDW16]|uniref:tRNA 2-thiouridine(34) synthase MnmA n=1 Tax=Thermomonas sp. HDW16 TaxID=2714945 RepID=UPI00140DBF7D|nr:tRNA 2-thiouridine(34) synthase MnmA [Thermomonas sp. HDW16]QIL20642.1 tRNA 2-thiouridine(34) synthase MnmA [Thermomonas sp. HDW16]